MVLSTPDVFRVVRLLNEKTSKKQPFRPRKSTSGVSRGPSQQAKSKANGQVRAKKRTRSATQPAERIFFSRSSAVSATEGANAAWARPKRGNAPESVYENMRMDIYIHGCKKLIAY